MKYFFLMIFLTSYFSFSEAQHYYKQVNLSNNNLIANYTKMKFLDTVVSVALDHQGIKDRIVVIENLSDETKKNFSGELKATVVYHNSAFYLFIDEHTHEDAIPTISHEVIHMQQYLNSDLVVENENIYWKEENWTLDNIPYELRPWEAEAFDKQTIIDNDVYSQLIGNSN